MIRVNLVPVLLGDGIRFFDNLRDAPIMLDDPKVTKGLRVTHLEYRVRRNTAEKSCEGLSRRLSLR